VVHEVYINKAFFELQKALAYRLNQKGRGTFASKHEIYGVLAEEMHELLCAIESNVPLKEVQKELRDIAVGCVFGDACIEAGAVDW
jgi:NTP pyrophosphatase (non-canonical NTP hydrolase)